MVRSTKVTAMLAQFAQALPNGVVNIMGGGLAVIPPELPMVFIAGNIQIGWDAIGVGHTMRFELLDDQGLPVVKDDGEPIVVDGQFNVAPNPGILRGTPLVMPLALGVGPLQLAPASRYEWKFEIDGESHEDWSLGFSTMPKAQPKAA
jgi:hypothetical protein